MIRVRVRTRVRGRVGSDSAHLLGHDQQKLAVARPPVGQTHHETVRGDGDRLGRKVDCLVSFEEYLPPSIESPHSPDEDDMGGDLEDLRG